MGGGGTYCLQNVIAGASCPNGYTGSPTTGLCEPPGGGGGAAGCTSNDECLAQNGTGSICTSSGDCQLGCTFDYTEGQSAACRTGEVCDPIPSYLLPDAGFLNYGYGHCVAPCNTPGWRGLRRARGHRRVRLRVRHREERRASLPPRRSRRGQGHLHERPRVPGHLGWRPLRRLP